METQLPPGKRAHPPHPIIGPCLLWPNGWMDEDATPEVDLGTGHTVLDVVPAVREWGTAAPSFRPCLLWPRSPISATAELMLLQFYTITKTACLR